MTPTVQVAGTEPARHQAASFSPFRGGLVSRRDALTVHPRPATWMVGNAGNNMGQQVLLSLSVSPTRGTKKGRPRWNGNRPIAKGVAVR